MKKLPITELEGMRILLVPLNESHIPAMFEYSSMPEFYIHMESLPHKCIEETAKYFNRLQSFINEGALYWAIVKKDINKTIGTVGIRNIDHQALSGELGLGISPLFWNMGIAKETDILVIDYFFNRLNYQKIISYTSIDNQGAVKTWNFMGYNHYTTIKNYYKKYDGSSYDALRAVLSRNNFNGNPQFKDFTNKRYL